MVSGWRVEVRDPDLYVTGQCDTFTTLRVLLRHRRAGSWAMTLPADHAQAALFTEGAGILVWAPWSTTTPVMSGPLTKLTTATPTRDAGSVLTVEGIDDTALLADRLVLPTPLAGLADQDVASHWTATGKAEEIIRDVVDEQAGDAGQAARRICDADPDSRRAAGTLVGTTRTVRARFDNLLTFVDAVATTDNLTVRLIQPGSSVQDRHLEVGVPVDRSASVRLSQFAGTLNSGTANVAAPTATNVLVAGGGEETQRVFVERSDAALLDGWARRIEVFRDSRGTTDTTELAETGDEVLADAAVTAGLSVQPVDTAAQRYGYEYNLGDTVSVEIDGVTWTEVVTAVELTLSAAEGFVARPMIGDPDLADDRSPLLYQRVRSILRRLDNLERSL